MSQNIKDYPVGSYYILIDNVKGKGDHQHTFFDRVPCLVKCVSHRPVFDELELELQSINEWQMKQLFAVENSQLLIPLKGWLLKYFKARDND